MTDHPPAPVPTPQPDRLPAAEFRPALSDTARAYAGQALSVATRRAYASHLRAWEAWESIRFRGAVRPLPW